MKCNELTIILFFILFLFKANAQEFKLGKVSIEELQQKVHPKDTSAVAAILFKKGESRFEYSNDAGFKVVTKVAVRIKIYKKDGYEWANQEINFRIGSLKENVDFSDAVTYNLVDGKIEKTKLKSEGEFQQNVNKYWDKKKITMPNVKVGSVIEYEYTVNSPNIGSLRDWNFQSSIPVNYSEYKTYIPEYFIYSTNQKGYVFPKVSVEKSTKSIIINSKERSGRLVAKTTFSQDKIDYMETRTTYIAENLPAMKDEVYVNNVANYMASLEQELSMTKYPNETLKPYSTNWNAVVKTIYEYDDFGPELNKTGYFEEDIDALIKNLDSPEEKETAIFTYVKSSVKWNNYYGYSCNDGVKKAYKDKTGNVAEINLMLTAMLRYAGLTANPVLISTRSNGVTLFPNRTAFNYVITAMETSNGLVLLDASDKFSTPNILPFRDLNWIGRLIRKDGTSEEVDLMPKVASNNVVTMNYVIDAKGLVSGKLRRQRTGHNAMVFRKDIDDVKEENYLEKLENDNEKIEIREYSRTNEKELKLPVTETFSYTGSNFSEIIGGKIYVNPMLFYGDNENPFKQENREYPIDYGFPFMDKYAINIQIPEGYKVETMPATTILSMADNLGSFKFMTSLSGNTIQMSVMYQINEPIIASDNYSILKEFYQKMIAKENEKIVLIKV